MKGKHLVIGLILFVLAISAAIYFTMMATYKSSGHGMETNMLVVENLLQQ